MLSRDATDQSLLDRVAHHEARAALAVRHASRYDLAADSLRRLARELSEADEEGRSVTESRIRGAIDAAVGVAPRRWVSADDVFDALHVDHDESCYPPDPEPGGPDHDRDCPNLPPCEWKRGRGWVNRVGLSCYWGLACRYVGLSDSLADASTVYREHGDAFRQMAAVDRGLAMDARLAYMAASAAA